MPASRAASSMPSPSSTILTQLPLDRPTQDERRRRAHLRRWNCRPDRPVRWEARSRVHEGTRASTRHEEEHFLHPSRHIPSNSWSRRLRPGWERRSRPFASIWRMRSRVHAVDLTDFLKGHVGSAPDTKAHPDHISLTFRQISQRVCHDPFSSAWRRHRLLEVRAAGCPSRRDLRDIRLHAGCRGTV